MDIKIEREAFELNVSPVTWECIEYNAENNIYMAKSKYWTSTIVQAVANEIDFGWKMWQLAKAQAVPEGFVLVPKEKISYFWQDNDEPENFCSNESDFDCLGDCIDLGEIIEINKFTQAHVNKEKLFGTWFAEAIDPSEKANFFVGTHAECLEIVAKNKAMIEAQEQN